MNDRDVNRIQWLDILKGFAIFLVVVGHSARPGTSLHAGIYAFHMPLFFFLSGYAMALSMKPGRIFYLVKRRFVSVLVPYVVWTCLFAYVFASYKCAYSVSLTSHLHQIIVGRLLWFLPALFCLQLLYSAYTFLTQYIRLKLGRLFVFMGLYVLIFVLHRLFGQTTINSPHWTIYWFTTSYIHFLPFFAGVFTCSLPKVEACLTKNGLFTALLWLVLLFCLFRVQGNWGKITIGTAISALMLNIFKGIPASAPGVKLMNFLGRHTLCIYIMHGAFFSPYLLESWHDYLSQQTLCYMAVCGIISLLSCIICALFSEAMQKNKYIAFLFLGKNIRRK